MSLFHFPLISQALRRTELIYFVSSGNISSMIHVTGSHRTHHIKTHTAEASKGRIFCIWTQSVWTSGRLANSMWFQWELVAEWVAWKLWFCSCVGRALWHGQKKRTSEFVAHSSRYTLPETFSSCLCPWHQDFPWHQWHTHCLRVSGPPVLVLPISRAGWKSHHTLKTSGNSPKWLSDRSGRSIVHLLQSSEVGLGSPQASSYFLSHFFLSSPVPPESPLPSTHRLRIF